MVRVGIWWSELVIVVRVGIDQGRVGDGPSWRWSELGVNRAVGAALVGRALEAQMTARH